MQCIDEMRGKEEKNKRKGRKEGGTGMKGHNVKGGRNGTEVKEGTERREGNE
jgi:hypothetical protein